MATTDVAPPARGWLTFEFVRHSLVWLMLASSFVVVIEPAPTDFLFLVAVTVFALTGLRVHMAASPLTLFLVLFLIGGLLSLIPVYNDTVAVTYMVISIYMAAAGLFFAFYLSEDTERRAKLMVHGWTFGAVVASVLGITGALDIAGTGALMSLQGRAQGLFKDPNVYSTYVILPAILLIQAIMLGHSRRRIIGPILLLTMLAGLFLSFSRGAWFNFVLAVLIMTCFNFTLIQSMTTKFRIIAIVIAGALAMAVIMAALLSNENVRELFLDRLTLVKDYDSGETGRFGNQLVSLPELLVSPNGFGPLQYYKLFYQDPHNSYLNAFASYGWLGGFSYFMLVASTIAAGFRASLAMTPLRPLAVCTTAVFISTSVQGLQIDTDHWRHFYWMIGIIWGIYSLTVMRMRSAQNALVR